MKPTKQQTQLASELKLLGFKITWYKLRGSYLCSIKGLVLEIHKAIIVAWRLVPPSRNKQQLVDYNIKSILEFMENNNVSTKNEN